MNNGQMQFLENINRDLKAAVGLAEVDYISANGLLKEFYANRRMPKSALLSHDFDLKIEVIIGRLQYMDIFTQRTDHLMSVHMKMIDSLLAPDFKESFFHLHVFQALTIKSDLLQSIGTIRSLLYEMKEYFQEINISLPDELFMNTHKVKEILQNITTLLLQAGGMREKLPIPTLTPDQIRILNSLYTMESERVVLNWFLTSMPGGSWDDLTQWYESELKKSEGDNIELF